MPWNDIINEIAVRKNNGQHLGLLNSNTYTDPIKSKQNTPPKTFASYKLGSNYGNIYFTKREAQCMVFVLKGKTINGVARALNLSPRTVEYYLKNMKIKLGCRTKSELIELVYASEFMKNVDF